MVVDKEFTLTRKDINLALGLTLAYENGRRFQTTSSRRSPKEVLKLYFLSNTQPIYIFFHRDYQSAKIGMP